MLVGLDSFFLMSLVGCGIVTLLYSLITHQRLVLAPTGTVKMVEIAQLIWEGAHTYLTVQSLWAGVVALVLGAFLYMILGFHVLWSFVLGGLLSGLAGFWGMRLSLKANVRTTEAAREGSEFAALAVAYNASSATGMLVVGMAFMAVLGVLLYFSPFDFNNDDVSDVTEALLGLSLGASLISIFTRMGGGIFTKGADIGADLVGKLEFNIPEDDPRNPAVIADNVGDNVGDCAGMAADLFETYVVTLVAALQVPPLFFTGLERSVLTFYPLGICAACLIASLIGFSALRLPFAQTPFGRLLGQSFGLSVILACGLTLGIGMWLFPLDYLFSTTDGVTISGFKIVLCALMGIGYALFSTASTGYYTSLSTRPVKTIAESSTSGHGTNVIAGLAFGLESPIAPILAMVLTVVTCYTLAGLLGVALCSVSMLSLSGTIVAMDAFGPIVDNAGGIAQMAGLSEKIRDRTDILDALGNTTKAITKGFAIGSAGLSSVVLFNLFVEELIALLPNLEIDLSIGSPFIIVGLLLGTVLPYAFTSLGMLSVGKAGRAIVEEVRNQFKQFPDILKGTQKPDYHAAIKSLTLTSIKAMIAPALLPVLVPASFFLAFYLCPELASPGISCLSGFLIGTVISGVCMGIFMTSAGGGWDNAKKYIEMGAHGGKGSPAYQAAVTGDTVGDPLKDTVGPAINPMIKIVNIVALLGVMMMARWG